MITTYANKTMFGKRTGKVTAELGDFNAEGQTATEAKSNLLTTVSTYRRTLYVIGTVDGDVFVVSRSLNGNMEYSICGKGRSYAAGCLMNITSAKDAIEQARKHAESSFGGVAWEHAG